MSKPNEELSREHAAYAVQTIGLMVGLVHCLTSSEEEIEDSDKMVAKAWEGIPKSREYIDGEPTKGDLRKYATACVKHMLAILEAK